jgi:hypothetical protein
MSTSCHAELLAEILLSANNIRTQSKCRAMFLSAWGLVHACMLGISTLRGMVCTKLLRAHMSKVTCSHELYIVLFAVTVQALHIQIWAMLLSASWWLRGGGDQVATIICVGLFIRNDTPSLQSPRTESVQKGVTFMEFGQTRRNGASGVTVLRASTVLVSLIAAFEMLHWIQCCFHRSELIWVDQHLVRLHE